MAIPSHRLMCTPADLSISAWESNSPTIVRITP
jgi:hypothetical protein